MAKRSRRRLVLSLFYFVLLIAGAAVVVLRLQSFDGLLIVKKGTTEHVAVCPAGAGNLLGATHRALVPELIPFNYPRAYQKELDPKAKYDAVEFPFALYLQQIETLETFPPRNVIEIYAPEGTVEHAVKAGDTLETEEGVLQVVEIRPWKGLIRHVQGEPMANVSLCDTEGRWLENLLLGVNTWLYLDRKIALRFQWFADEAAARAALPEALPGLESARWGVRDGERMQWIENFTPGMGVVLEDDTAVMLRRAEMAHEEAGVTGPALQLRKVGPKGQEEFWLRPNGDFSEDEILFDYPAGHETVIYLHAWREGNAVATIFQQGELLGTEIVTAQHPWQPMSGQPFALLLEQCLPNALNATESQQEVWETIVESSGGRTRLRQGLRLRADEIQLSYRRIPVPPRLACQFAIQLPDLSQPASFTLHPGESVRYETWRFTLLDIPDPMKPTCAHFRVQRSIGGPFRILGMLMIIGGFLGLILIRFRAN